MKLKPFDPTVQILKEAGILAKPSSSDVTVDSDFKAILDNNGASLNTAAAAIAMTLRSADDGIKLRAADLVLKAHGILKDAERASVPSINITIVGKENANLLELLTPQEA